MKKAIIVGIDYYKKGVLSYYIEELNNLASSLGIDIVHTFTQSVEMTNPATKVGKGKLEEIARYTQENSVEYVLFNDELTNSQIRNLEETLNLPVIDRTLLILEIFAKRAKTKEAMLQVEVAQLKYLKPRLSAMRASFEQQQGGIGQKGPGEKKLELDRRKIDHDINKLEKQLKALTNVRKANRSLRQNKTIKNVAIVGYTNAGKSTLLNTLYHLSDVNGKADIQVQDRLFATLETSTRRIKLKDKKPFTLTDTIGFISQLPHELIDSFKATLEEITEADLLLHVVDFSHPYYLDQIDTTQKVLQELGADEIETLYIFNKIDHTDAFLPEIYKPSVKVSLKEHINIDALVEHITYSLFKNDTTAIYLIPQNKGEIINYLNETSEIIDTSYENNSVKIKAKVDIAVKNKLKHYEV